MLAAVVLSRLVRLGCVGGDGRGTWIHGDAVVLMFEDAPVADRRLCGSAGGLPPKIDGMARNAAVPGFAGEVPRCRRRARDDLHCGASRVVSPLAVVGNGAAVGVEDGGDHAAVEPVSVG